LRIIKAVFQHPIRHRHVIELNEETPMAHDHHLAPNAADVEAAHAQDVTETVVPVIPVVLPVVGALMMFLLAFIAVHMA
jgi:hypothetical protein